MMRYGFDGFDGFDRFGHMSWIGGGIMMLVGLAILVLLVIGVIALFRGSHMRHNGHSDVNAGQSSGSIQAMNILDERYARGEINDEEYQRKKAEIRKG